MDTDSLPFLSPAELRVLGALIEKSKTTPDYYPMTVNGLTAACNQKTSRFPVVDYTEETVMEALGSLKAKSLVATAVGGTSRTTKYKHNFNIVFPVSSAELVILCLLFLRGPQTPGELNTNSGRLHPFESLHEVIESLHHLMHQQTPFVKELPRRPGQKETRFAHLLGEIHEEALAEEEKGTPGLEERVATLEAEVRELNHRLDQALKRLGEWL